jgi:ParB family chromosome partitioning protein
MAGRVVAEGMSVRNVEEAVQLARSDSDVPAAKPRGGRSRAAAPPELTELADRLSDRFETRVKVDMGRSRGKVTIDFGSVEDLHRIVALLDAPAAGVPEV